MQKKTLVLRKEGVFDPLVDYWRFYTPVVVEDDEDNAAAEKEAGNGLLPAVEVRYEANLEVFLDEKLGKGAQAQVFKGRYTLRYRWPKKMTRGDGANGAEGTGEEPALLEETRTIEVAVKRLIQKEEEQEEDFPTKYALQEIETLKKLPFNNRVVQFIDDFTNLDECKAGPPSPSPGAEAEEVKIRWMALEYIPLDLASLLAEARRQDFPLGRKYAYAVARDIAGAIKWLHDHNIAHRDLKPANILVTTRTIRSSVMVKLADFGVSKALSEDASKEVQHTIVGTPGYMPPELNTRGFKEYNPKAVDVYCFGVMLQDILEVCPSHQLPLYELADVVAVCTDANPEKRPSFEWITQTLKTRSMAPNPPPPPMFNPQPMPQPQRTPGAPVPKGAPGKIPMGVPPPPNQTSIPQGAPIPKPPPPAPKVMQDSQTQGPTASFMKRSAAYEHVRALNPQEDKSSMCPVS